LVVAAISALGIMGLGPATSHADFQLPPIRHVWVIVLENSSYEKTEGLCCSPFNTPGEAPYLADVLTEQGNLLTQYWGIGHNSQANYVAMISGQSPTPGTQSDALFCAGGQLLPLGVSDEIPDASPVDPHGQIVGQGCT